LHPILAAAHRAARLRRFEAVELIAVEARACEEMPRLQLPGGDGGGFHVAKGRLHAATGRKLESSDFTTRHFSGRLVLP